MKSIPKKIYYEIEKLVFGGRPLPVFRLSKQAPIFVSFWFDYFRNAEKIAVATAKYQEPVFMFKLGYHCETQERLEEIKEQVEGVREFLQDTEMYFLCNSEREQELLGEEGFRTILCNQNAFIDEKGYPILRRKKRYDAVYLARFTPCKRHSLARNIPRLKLIGSHLPYEADHFSESLKILSHASWTEKIPARSVPSCFAEAHVGLCLSDVEGSMYVSAEYLLCGLPVVSTPSIGGRDTFFDPRWVAIADPEPEAIEKAVRELKERPISPQLIRQETIVKIQEHRARFIDLVQRIYDERGVEGDFSQEWNTAFIHKFGLRTHVSLRNANRILREKN